MSPGGNNRSIKIAMNYGASGGWLNMGDTAMLQNIISRIKTSAPGATVICLSERLDRTIEKLGISHEPSLSAYCDHSGLLMTVFYRVFRIFFRRYARRVRGALRVIKSLWFLANAWLHSLAGFSFLFDFRARRLLQTMKECDALWVSGGGYIGDQWFWSVTWRVLLTCAAFKWHHKTVVMSGQQIGPLTGRARKWHMSFFLNHYVDILYVRDTTTAELLGAIHVRPDLFGVLLDDAGTLPPIQKEQAEEILRGEFPELEERFIVVHYRTTDYNDLAGTSHSLASFLDFLIERTGMHTVFVSLSYLSSNDDRVAANEVVSSMRNRGAAHVVSRECEPQQTKAIIGLSTFAVGVSHHFALFSLIMSVPTLCLYKNQYYLHKFAGLTALFGHPEWLVGIDDLYSSSVRNRALKMIDGFDDTHERLKQLSRQLSGEWENTIRQVLSQISHEETTISA